MSKTPSSTRVMVDIGYNKYILPKEVSADALAILANAVYVSTIYVNGDNNLYIDHYNGSKITIKIINDDEFKNFMDARDKEHEDYDIIISEVKEKLGDSNHGVIIFGKENIRVCGEKIEYGEMSNPDFDPQALIDKIVDLAINNPIRI